MKRQGPKCFGGYQGREFGICDAGYSTGVIQFQCSGSCIYEMDGSVKQHGTMGGCMYTDEPPNLRL